jgi:hypothetical protein
MHHSDKWFKNQNKKICAKTEKNIGVRQELHIYTREVHYYDAESIGIFVE